MTILSTDFQIYNTKVKLNHYTATDHISKKIINGKTFYENGMLNYIYNNIPRGTFIDAGANIGNHTVFFGMFCADKVYAIEPIPENIEILSKNIKDNNLTSKVEIIPYGLGLESTNLKIVRFDQNMGSCMLEANPDPAQTVENKKKIINGDTAKVITLAETPLMSINNLTLIKIDCENMSMDVLKSLMPLIEIHKPHIFMEATPKDIRAVEALIQYQAVKQFNATPTFHFKPR